MGYTKCWIVLTVGLLPLGPYLSAKNPSEARAEQDRLPNAGTVMQEILKMPDDIPQDLIDKSRCVVVMPSVVKALTSAQALAILVGTGLDGCPARTIYAGECGRGGTRRRTSIT